MRPSSPVYMLKALFLTLLLAGIGECGRHRYRRSFLSLGDMVSTLTDMNPASFVDYGLWCGFGGGGEPVDQVDRCCRSHDHCYDAAHATVCKAWEGHLLLINYRYEVKETDVTCRSGQTPCSSAVCVCDLNLAICLRKHRDSYDPRNNGLRSRTTSPELTNGTTTTPPADDMQKL